MKILTQLVNNFYYTIENHRNKYHDYRMFFLYKTFLKRKNKDESEFTFKDFKKEGDIATLYYIWNKFSIMDHNKTEYKQIIKSQDVFIMYFKKYITSDSFDRDTQRKFKTNFALLELNLEY